MSGYNGKRAFVGNGRVVADALIYAQQDHARGGRWIVQMLAYGWGVGCEVFAVVDNFGELVEVPA